MLKKEPQKYFWLVFTRSQREFNSLQGEKIHFLLGHASVQATERYLGKQNLGHPVNDLFDLGADHKPHKTSSELAASRTVR